MAAEHAALQRWAEPSCLQGPNLKAPPDFVTVAAYNKQDYSSRRRWRYAMAVRQPHLSKEEHARRGTEIYEQQVRPKLEAGNHGKIVAIDVDTGDFEMADQTLLAAERLLARRP